MHYAALLLFAATLIPAQVLLDPQSRQGQAAKALLERPSASGKLPCKVHSLPPTLNFALRHSGGYRAMVPLAQLPSQGTTLAAVFRVQAQGAAEAAYFRHLYRLPRIPPNSKLWVLLDGGFFLGAGLYDVDWMLTDLEGRECRSRWRVELRPKDKAQPSRQLMAPGQVASLRLTSWKTHTEPRPFRIAAFLHVAPIWLRATMLSPFDQSVLMTTLTSLFESGPFEESSVVAFSLQKQRELYRVDRLTNQRLQRLLEVMDNLELGTIDVREMSDPRRYLGLLANLVNREQASEKPPDAIVFIGPQNRYDFKFPKDFVENVPADRRPPMFYLRYSYFLRFVPFPDSIEKLVKSQGGKVFNIGHPSEFLAALRKMEEILRERSATVPASPTSRAAPESDNPRREP